jgi:uncharacterized heparinase superfamily protein
MLVLRRAGQLFRDLLRLYHTVRYLRARQLWYQLRHRLFGRRLATHTIGLKAVVRRLQLVPWVRKPISFVGHGRFRFLNNEILLGEPPEWSANAAPLLWRYNLHYFDYLHQDPPIDSSVAFGLMRDWVQRHPPEESAVGWEPYPISLRVVNWLKFMASHETFPEDLVQSLALQGENLEKQIEYHLLGNHLFANAKALWFLGAFLQNQRWLRIGRALALSELDEQFLPDGGHVELTPMYHAIAVEEVLDLINIALATNDTPAAKALRQTAGRALGWLRGMSATSGRAPLLNDSANGVAPSLEQLTAYGERLNVQPLESGKPMEFSQGWRGHEFSGYWLIENRRFELFFDTAMLGPDYLPGHAHCDMLSVLLNFEGKPVLTDTGVFEYAESDRRTYSRSTAAHNTVMLDNLEQADIWKSFRMGKRGHPANRSISATEIACEHTGFHIQSRGLVHRRAVRLLSLGFEIVDTVTGPEEHRFDARFHFAPGIEVRQISPTQFSVRELIFTVIGSEAAVRPSEMYPEFGRIEQRSCLTLSGKFAGRHEFGLRCTYSS